MSGVCHDAIQAVKGWAKLKGPSREWRPSCIGTMKCQVSLSSEASVTVVMGGDVLSIIFKANHHA